MAASRGRNVTKQGLHAGNFSSWLRRARIALTEETGTDVPCDGCFACCTSSHFVHIGPEETNALARIPRELLFAAPGLPKGHALLGYDEGGRCPMLAGNRCSIYDVRPYTCRNYDCRVFAAAGVAADKDLITQRVRRWRFGYPTPQDRLQHAAVRAAARFVQGHARLFPGGATPRDPAHVSVLAVKVSDVFLDLVDESGRAKRVAADLEIANAIVETNERFEARRVGRAARSE
jgi:uncharacterized protein